MPTPPDLASLPLGTRVQDPLVVLDVTAQHAEDVPFTILTLGNALGSIESAPFWTADQPKIAGITRGAVVQVIGEVTSYRDRRQLKVSSIRVLPRETVDWGPLVPGVGDPVPWWDALDKWRRDISAPRLRAVLALFYEDAEFRDRFATAPGGLAGPHARRGGLLKLTAEVVAAARPLARIAGGDIDLVVTGALLHGIGYPECYTDVWPFGLTARGALSTPMLAGTRLLEARVREATPPPVGDRELLVLQHILAGAEEGSPVTPRVVEAEAVRLAVGACRRIAGIADMARRAAPPVPAPGEAPLRRDGDHQFWDAPLDWGR